MNRGRHEKIDDNGKPTRLKKRFTVCLMSLQCTQYMCVATLYKKLMSKMEAVKLRWKGENRGDGETYDDLI